MVQHVALVALTELVDVLVRVADQVKRAACRLLDELDYLVLDLVQVLRLVHEQHADVAVSPALRKGFLLHQLRICLYQLQRFRG